MGSWLCQKPSNMVFSPEGCECECACACVRVAAGTVAPEGYVTHKEMDPHISKARNMGTVIRKTQSCSEVAAEIMFLFHVDPKRT